MHILTEQLKLSAVTLECLAGNDILVEPDIAGAELLQYAQYMQQQPHLHGALRALFATIVLELELVAATKSPLPDHRTLQ